MEHKENREEEGGSLQEGEGRREHRGSREQEEGSMEEGGLSRSIQEGAWRREHKGGGREHKERKREEGAGRREHTGESRELAAYRRKQGAYRREEGPGNSCQLTLDPNTAHRELCLSEGNRKVTCRRETQRYQDHPERFDDWDQVLCREGLTGTRCYWEIEWSGEGADIGVTYKGISRKGMDDSCGLGYNDKSWSLECSDSSYTALHNNNETAITAPRSPRIGVYLDFNAGTLSFYGVSDTMTLLHRFQTTFTEPLYPGFGLDYDSSVTICQLN
ncbi:UNVERIFIED_CONTAM: hypothetical protein FKN15_035291 [Acipenser sinensis]